MKSTHLRLGAAVLLLASALAIFGISQLVTASPAPPAEHEATIDSMTAAVTTASWTEMDHEMSGTSAPGFQMPPAMMPGMPTGEDQRLAVTLTVTNTSDATRPLEPAAEFALRTSGDGKAIAPKTHTFGELPRLAPQNAVSGVLFFDLPPSALAGADPWIEWRHGSETGRITVPLGDDAPDHSGGH